MAGAASAGSASDEVEWAPLPEADRDASEEIRFAAVLNGGVSLAVWMGGVTYEVDALTRREGVYGRILTALDARARVDIIAGTSAGGINGAALACAQVRTPTDPPAFGRLLDTWSEQGALQRLVTPPGTPEPRSVLQGDGVFLPRLQEAFHTLLPDNLTSTQMYGPQDRPIRLRLTTTMLNPVLLTTRDSLGTDFVQEQHHGRFTFTRPWLSGQTTDHFAPAATQPKENSTLRRALPDALGLASRCTASFPVAFEPVYVPVHEDLDVSPPRPDMQAYSNFAVSRWVVDGGVLMNTPLPLVLDDIAEAPADRQVRRILLLVVPDPTDPTDVENTPDKESEPVNVRDTLIGVVSSTLAKSIADDFDDLQRHNRAALTRRKARTDLLKSLTDAAAGPSDNTGAHPMETLAAGLFPSYRRIRIRRIATDLAARAAAASAQELADAPEPEDELVTDIHRQLWTIADESQPPQLPFLPPAVNQGYQADPGWEWGRSPLERLAATVQDLQRRAIWVLPDGAAELASLHEDRTELHAWRAALSRATQDDGDRWEFAFSAADGQVDVLADLLNGWTVQTLDPSSAGNDYVDGRDLALRLCALGERAAAAVGVPERIAAMDDLGGSSTWRLQALVDTFRTVQDLNDDEKLQRLMALDVCLVCLSDGTDDTAEDVVDLVQISTSVTHDFATKPPLQRVAGLGLNHFAAFLKQSWRVNDWTWGQLDGADRLVAALLDPVRLRRQVILGRPAPDLLRGLLGLDLLGDAAGAPDWFPQLAHILNTRVPTADEMQDLRRALVLERANTVVREAEKPLARAIEIDLEEGANPDSTGKQWLAGYRERQRDGAV